MANSITTASAFTGETFTPDDSDYTLSNEMATAAVRSLLARIEALEAEVQSLKGGSN